MTTKKHGLCFSLVLSIGILTFLVAASGALPGAAVHATPLPAACSSGVVPCLIGTNLEVMSVTGALYSGSGPCVGGTNVYDTSATNPGIGTTGLPTPCSTPTSTNGTQTGTLVVEALNGYMIDDFSYSVGCGVTGNNSLTFSGTFVAGGTTTPFSTSCPTETTVGATGTLSGEYTFLAPVAMLTVNTTLTDIAFPGGSSSLSSATDNFSLVTPEPGSLALFCTGLAGLAGITRKRLRGR